MKIFNKAFRHFGFTLHILFWYALICGSIDLVQGIPDKSQPAVETILRDAVPVAQCMDSVTVYLDFSGNATLSFDQIDNGSTGFSSFDIIPSTFDCADVGTQTVTLFLLGSDLMVDDCTAQVTVIDTIPPVAVCDENLTISFTDSGSIHLKAADVDEGTFDVCGIASLAISTSTITCQDIGLIPITMTATDVNGNSSFCWTEVPVNDEQKPTASCEPSINVQVNSGELVLLTPDDIDAGSTDNCGIEDRQLSEQRFDCGDEGVHPITLTVIDSSGNRDSCVTSVVVQVNDTEPPMLTCRPTDTVALGFDGTAIVTAADLIFELTEECVPGPITLSQEQFDCNDVGLNTITVTAADASGNEASCTAQVVVVDTIPPWIICDDFVNISIGPSGIFNLTPDIFDEGSMDPCGLGPSSVSPAQLTCQDVGTSVVELIVTDVSGNQSRCLSLVSVEDKQVPSALCNPTLSVQVNSGETLQLDPADVDAGSTDDCGVLDRRLSKDLFDCQDAGLNQVTFTVTDPAGNQDSCFTFIDVQVNDTEPPMLTCGPTDTVALGFDGTATVTAADLIFELTENCGLDTITLSQEQFDCNDIGLNAVVVTASDASGNEASCITSILVVDSLPPVPLCESVISIALDSNGLAELTPDMVEINSFDQCGLIDLQIEPRLVSCADVGQQVGQLFAVDQSGNVGFCTFNLFVSPAIDAPEFCDDPDQDGVVAGFDNCPDIPNPDQRDADSDGAGDACDRCFDPTPDVLLLVTQADMTGDTTIQSGFRLETSGNVAIGSGQQVTLIAEDRITLRPGASITAGAEATLRIDVCDEPQTLSVDALSVQQDTLDKPTDFVQGGFSRQRDRSEGLQAQIWPNPLRSEAWIRWFLPHPEPVTIQVFDQSGRLRQTILDQELRNAGEHVFRWDTHQLAPGYYVIRLQTAQGALIQPIIRLRD